MTAEPDPKQILILWGLLARGGAAAQKGLVPAVGKKDRDALQEAGLIAVEKGQRQAIRLEVTEKGWGWASEHLGAALPSGRNATRDGTPILQAWLTRLQAYLRASGVSLAEILTAAPEETPALRQPMPAERSETAEPAYDDLRKRVREAYFELTGGHSKDGVPLSKIRGKLGDVRRDALDAALARMHGESGTTLMSLDNPREIAAERDAALNFKGEPMHVLWITR